MRSHSPDLTLVRSEIATRLGLLDLRSDEDFEQECRSYLCDLRWPGGVECPRCSEHSRLLWLTSRSKWHCYSCRYQFSVTAGTVFHSSHLPVWKWFVAVHLLLASQHGLSAYELRRAIGGSYKTAWFAAHRIRAAMRGDGAGLLRNLVEAELRDAGVESAPAPADLVRANDRVLARMRRVAGPHHPLSVKYLPAYIDERRWRSAHEGNPFVFRDTIHALLHSEGISYDRLVAAA
ncbi:MAG TPA: IS1595 family transposase [Gaiellaceae bacterium]|jgi:transposase-like protein|nr:IS1595 family transposase [Gaiellaceae bacterium]